MKPSRIALVGLFVLVAWHVSATVHADAVRTASAQASPLGRRQVPVRPVVRGRLRPAPLGGLTASTWAADCSSTLAADCSSTWGAEHKAVLIVQFGAGQSQQMTIAFGEETLSGLDLLTRSGLKLSMWGSAVCRIEAQGCAYPLEPCFCQCRGAPCAYWSYWHWQAGRWVYSPVGAASHQVHDGDIEGWAWSDGQPPSVTPTPGTALTPAAAEASDAPGQPGPALSPRETPAPAASTLAADCSSTLAADCSSTLGVAAAADSTERVPLEQYAVFVVLALALAGILVVVRQRGRG